MKDNATPGPTDQETLDRGTRFEVVQKNGKRDVVTIRQLTLRQIREYMEAERAEDAARCAELLAGKPAGWSDVLTVESATALILEGLRVNASPFENFVRFRVEQSKWAASLVGTVRQPSLEPSPESASEPA